MIRRSTAPAALPAGPRDREAFTLIELLVVVSIIASLASLLLPAVSRAREAGRTAACASNVHQISVALQIYVDENHHYPGYYSWIGSQPQFWPQALEPHTGQKWTNQLYQCPSFKGTNLLALTPMGPSGASLLGSYGYNDWIFGYIHRPVTFALSNSDTTNYSAELHESQVAVPADMIAIGDGNYTPFHNGSGFLPLPRGPVVFGIGSLNKSQSYFHGFPPDLQREALRLTKLRHQGRYNIAFCDGHLERIAHERLYDGSDASLRRWNRDHEPHR